MANIFRKELRYKTPTKIITRVVEVEPASDGGFQVKITGIERDWGGSTLTVHSCVDTPRNFSTEREAVAFAEESVQSLLNESFEYGIDDYRYYTIKLRANGKDHQLGNPRCGACEQGLSSAIAHFPYIDTSGKPTCGGLVHSESFGNLNTGMETLYQCDRCGQFH